MAARSRPKAKPVTPTNVFRRAVEGEAAIADYRRWLEAG